MKLAVLHFALALLLGGCTTSPPGGWVRPALPTHVEAKADFDRLDLSGNGAISLAEWRDAGSTLFWRRDRDGDGFLVTAEISDSQLMYDLFVRADAIRDGRLSRAEFDRLRDLIFGAVDIMHDDSLVPVEYEVLVLARRSGWEDTRGYGRITSGELLELLKKSLPLLDRDGDGVLTGSEDDFFRPADRQAMDPKGTGRITLEQMNRAYRWLVGFDPANRNL